MTQRQSNLPSAPMTLGPEKLNPQALDRIERRLFGDEAVVFYSGFDFESKVIALTNQRVMVADKDSTVLFVSRLEDLSSVTSEGRELALNAGYKSAKYRMRDADTVAEIVGVINRLRNGGYQHRPGPNSATGSGINGNDLQSPNIADRVRFWEEQDKINQELIPRVIRQNELLASHIADHENLPLVAGNAISEALAEAREEQRRQHEAEVADLRAEAAEQARQHQAELEAARAEREEQNRQHQAELASAQEERQQQAAALAEAKAAAAEQARQHQAELAAAQAEREAQSRQHSSEVTTLQGQLRQAKSQFLMVAGGAVVIAIAGAVIGILV